MGFYFCLMQTEKLLVIPDLHGNSLWQNLVFHKDYRKIIFLGDYFDSRNFSIGICDEIENFRKICQLKTENSDKVEMLCGNHDLHYLRGIFSKSSGYQFEHAKEIERMLQPFFDEKILKMCYYDNVSKTLFSHAGISMKWLQSKIGNTSDDSILRNLEIKDFNADFVANSINLLFYHFPQEFEYQEDDDDDGSGDSAFQGPCWIRPYSLLQNILPVSQVVGHTQQKEITKIKNVWFTDTFNCGSGFLEL